MNVCRAELVGGAVVGFLCVCCRDSSCRLYTCMCGCVGVCVWVWVWVYVLWTFIAPFMALPCGCAMCDCSTHAVIILLVSMHYGARSIERSGAGTGGISHILCYGGECPGL